MTRSFFRLCQTCKLEFAFCLFLLFVPATPSRAQDQHWNNTSGGDFGDPANWNTAVPGANDNAIFPINSNYGVELSTHFVVGSLQQQQGSVRLFGGNSLTVNSVVDLTGNLAVDGFGTWLSASDDILVRGQSNLTVINEALISGADLVVGGDIGSNASANILGGQTTLHVDNLLLGTTDGVSDGGLGDVNLTGKLWLGDLPTDTDYIISIGSSIAGANLVLRNGSKLVFDNPNQVGNSAFVAEQENSVGNILISGLGSEIDAPDLGLIFGYRGQANLTIENGGVAELLAFNAGFYEESNGNILITGAGSRLSTNYTNIGWVYGHGSMMISDGGLFEGELEIGDLGGQGVVTVAGQGSSIDSGEIKVGTSYSPSVEQFSHGELHIQDGGVVSSSGDFCVGAESKSTGVVTISGVGSKLFADCVLMKPSGNEVAPGDGRSRMTIFSTGALSIGDDIPAASDASLTISGEAGQFSETTLFIGETAILENNGAALLGYWFDKKGIAEVEGEGAVWNNTGDLEIGFNGSGEVSVRDSGSLVVGGETTVNADSLLIVDNGDFTSLGGLVSEGAIELKNGGKMFGDVSILAGSTFSIAGSVDVHGDFSLPVDFSAFSVLDNEVGSVTFHGNCEGLSNIIFSFTSTLESVRFENEVILPSFGSSRVGTFSAADDVYLGSGSTLKIRIGETFGGFESDNISCDRLHVESGATLDLSIVSGTVLELGEQYSIVTQKDRSGAVAQPFAGLEEGDFVTSFGGVNLFITYVAGDGNDIAVYTGGTRIVTPQSVTVTRGTLGSGAAQELSNSDNEDLSIRRRNSDIQSRTEFEVESQSTTLTPSSLEIRLEGAVFGRTTVGQKVWLFDHFANDWEEVDSRTASRFVDRTDIVVLGGDLTRFVEQSTGLMRARVRYMSVNPRQQFTSYSDSFAWRIGD